jgi:hypothetical protein
VWALRGIYPRYSELALWLRDFPTSAAQIQKTYDWRIAQWSALGTAVLTTSLGFLSGAALELIKNPALWHTTDELRILSLGFCSSITLYLLVQLRIARLRRTFETIYTIMCVLK